MISNLPRPLVLATGVFDLLHAEHLMLLQYASSISGNLIVGINSDDSVRRLKGPGRPIIGQHDRVAMLAALRCVDQVMVFEEDTPLALIMRLRPDVLVKGHDYGHDGKPMPEAELLKEWGGRVSIAPTTDRVSTSKIIDRVFATRLPWAPTDKLRKPI